MESRVVVSARRFRDLGASTAEEIEPLLPIDKSPRILSAPEFVPENLKPIPLELFDKIGASR
jgi:hypothetical protein